MLHAYQLEFRHPVTGKEMEIIGKVPVDFVETMKKMGISGEKLLKCGKIQWKSKKKQNKNVPYTKLLKIKMHKNLNYISTLQLAYMKSR